ncbi:2-iminobutanoate/2-iminopropanoate deaminase [Bradyrhizobium sp. USDA 326]|uniref:RidA family protein n=1 Tax=unclassified Bradyrhizobium TaxID=2631580 RepID=UPI003516F1FC
MASTECAEALQGQSDLHGMQVTAHETVALLLSDNKREMPMRSHPVEHLRPESLSAGGQYSAAVRAAGFLYVSGQTPRGDDRKVIGETIEEQTEATLARLERVLQSAGVAMSDLIKVTIYLADLNDSARFNAVYARHFSNNPPARTTIGCALNGVLIAIDAVAYNA